MIIFRRLGRTTWARLASVGALVAGCTGEPSAPDAPTSNATSAGAETPVEPAPGYPEVSWQFVGALRIEPDGTLHRDAERVGRFGPGGELVTPNGRAHLDADGTLMLGDEPTPFRVVGDVVYERDTQVMHIEQGQLVLEGEGSLPLIGFHPGRTREVLITSTLMLLGLAAAYTH